MLQGVFLPCLAAQLAGEPGGGAELAASALRGPAELYRHAQQFASLLAHTREQVEGEPAGLLLRAQLACTASYEDVTELGHSNLWLLTS